MWTLICISIAAAILAIATLIFGYFWFPKFIWQVFSSKNLKTYVNEKYGYEIKYPADWLVREYPDAETGAGFRQKNTAPEIQSECININISKARPAGDYKFENYVKEAAVDEIQNFEKLNSIEKINSEAGVGYETTWIYKDYKGVEKVSLPITYFNYPNSKDGNFTVQVSLEYKDCQKTYDQMLPTFNLLK